MAYLKEKISEKKRSCGADKKGGQVNQDLLSFITRVGMADYLQKIEENGIDSYDILKGSLLLI